MTDRETLDRARLLFVGDTQGDKLAREVIEIAEERAQTIACEVEHSRKLEDQLKDLHGMLAPLKYAVLFARAQRRPMGIGQDHSQAAASAHLSLGTQYGRERYNDGFWIESEDVVSQDADSPNPAKRILMISTASLLDDGREMKLKPRRYSGNSHQRRKQRRKVGP